MNQVVPRLLASTSWAMIGMRLRYLNNLTILSGHNFVDRRINNFGLIGHHGPIVQASISFIKIIYLIITGFRSYWIDCDSRET